MKNNILVIGNCGVGKTWVMKEIIKQMKDPKTYIFDLIHFKGDDKTNVLGVYNGAVFEGSDRLSMAVMKSVDEYLMYAHDKITIAEGDRFTNSKYISKASPIIIKILGSGEEGRELRGSTQSDRQIKSIETRVNNIVPDIEVLNSLEALDFILDHINKAHERS